MPAPVQFSGAPDWIQISGIEVLHDSKLDLVCCLDSDCGQLQMLDDVKTALSFLFCFFKG